MTGQQHELTVQGHPVSELAARFGTPLFVYDGAAISDGYRRLRELLHPAIEVFYSAKANPNVSVCALLRSLGAGIEVSSMTELETARLAGVAPRDIIFLGPGKSAAELRAGAELGLRAVVCESLEELAQLDATAPASGCDAMLRVNPSFSAKGSGLSMGGKPRQFGIDQQALAAALPSLRRLARVNVIGIHAYMGTRILDALDVVRNTRGILAAAQELAGQLDIPLSVVDIGGGLGVAYFDNEKDLDLATAMAGVNEAVTEFTARHPDCRLIMELGRYLVGFYGTYVISARYVKESMGEWFVVADGGTNHHMAAVGIGSFVKRNFPIRSLTRYSAPATRAYNITGPLCTPNDVIGKNVELPEVRPGDLLGVERSGAYGPTASPGLFLSHGFPAEVLVLDGEPHLVRHRDTVADLLSKQVLIPAGSRRPHSQLITERP
jgi:diaminopimelate decarboxylase